MIPLSPRMVKIMISSCAAVGLLVLGAAAAFQAVDGDGQDDTVSKERPAQVRDLPKTTADLAVLPPARDDQSRPMDESSAVQGRIEGLKMKLKAENTDFTRMRRDLEDRLSRAPDGKITPDEILAVIPPAHREEFKSILTSMYAKQSEPMTMKETRP